MKLVREEINFERGEDPKASMGIGRWKDYDDTLYGRENQGRTHGLVVSIDEFLDNGGKLEPGRELWSAENPNEIWPSGEYLGYDDKQKVHLGKNGSFKSFPIVSSKIGVRVPAKVLYV